MGTKNSGDFYFAMEALDKKIKNKIKNHWHFIILAKNGWLAHSHTHTQAFTHRKKKPTRERDTER